MLLQYIKKYIEGLLLMSRGLSRVGNKSQCHAISTVM